MTERAARELAAAVSAKNREIAAPVSAKDRELQAIALELQAKD
jgi:hypothetical protein